MPGKGGKQVYSKSKLVSKGTILIDVLKKRWIIGDLIGEGGFGYIYLAKLEHDINYEQVVKIEPQVNGPLFSEINFYIRACIDIDIKNWVSKNKLNHLGVPRHVSNGIYSDNRFLIMDRYGKNLQYTLTHQKLNASTIFQIAINLLDILEYIHDKKYVHSDVKALNILRDNKLGQNIYLVDFGIVSKFVNGESHYSDKIDKKRQHDGTPDFCSRDSHIGRRLSRRSDIESLLYNLIYWLTWNMNNPKRSSNEGYGNLPWMGLIAEFNKTRNNSILNQVADMKEKYMFNSDLFIESVGLNSACYALELKQMINKINKIPYQAEPDYNDFRCHIVKMYCLNENIKYPKTNHIDFNKYRSINWGAASNSTVSRKRRSSGIIDDGDDETSEINDFKPQSKQAKRQVGRKKCRNSNNNTEDEIDLDEMSKLPPISIGKVKVKDCKKPNDNKKNFNSPSENNNNSKKVAKKYTTVNTTSTNRKSNNSDIIPGIKTLKSHKLSHIPDGSSTIPYRKTSCKQEKQNSAVTKTTRPNQHNKNNLSIIPGLLTIKRLKEASSLSSHKSHNIVKK